MFNISLNNYKKSYTSNDLNKIESKYDIKKIDTHSYSLIYKNINYTISNIIFNEDQKSFTLDINNKNCTIKIESDIDILLKSLNIEDIKSTKLAFLNAPMPGLILDILVEEEQEIKAGEKLMVIEAMKMENIIKAAQDIKIKKIKILVGDTITKNQVLLEFY